MSKPIKVTLLGAGGKMGGRVTANLRNLSQYKIAYVEASPERQKEMAAGGIETTPLEQALDTAEAYRGYRSETEAGNNRGRTRSGRRLRGDHAETRGHHLFCRSSVPSPFVF